MVPHVTPAPAAAPPTGPPARTRSHGEAGAASFADVLGAATTQASDGDVAGSSADAAAVEGPDTEDASTAARSDTTAAPEAQPAPESWSPGGLWNLFTSGQQATDRQAQEQDGDELASETVTLADIVTMEGDQADVAVVPPRVDVLASSGTASGAVADGSDVPSGSMPTGDQPTTVGPEVMSADPALAGRVVPGRPEPGAKAEAALEAPPASNGEAAPDAAGMDGLLPESVAAGGQDVPVAAGTAGGAAQAAASHAATAAASAGPGGITNTTHAGDATPPEPLARMDSPPEPSGVSTTAAPHGAGATVDPASLTKADASSLAAEPLVTAAAPLPVRPQADPVAPAPMDGVPTASAETADVVLDQVVKSLRLQWKNGLGEARILLRPEHLGPVNISLKVDGGAVTAVVRAESAQVQEWIVSHQQTLRQQLEAAGLTLDELVVTPDGERRRQGDAESQGQRPNGPRRRHDDEDTTLPRFEVVV